MGELWIIEPNGNTIIKKVDREKNERHAKHLKEYIVTNKIDVELDDSIYNLGINMAKKDYCIIDIDNENAILFLGNMTLEQIKTVKKYLPFFSQYPVRYVDVSDDIKNYSHEIAITKIYKKIKRK